MNKNYVFFDITSDSWKVVLDGTVMSVMHETKIEAEQNLRNLVELDSRMFPKDGRVILNG